MCRFAQRNTLRIAQVVSVYTQAVLSGCSMGGAQSNVPRHRRHRVRAIPTPTIVIDQRCNTSINGHGWIGAVRPADRASLWPETRCY